MLLATGVEPIDPMAVEKRLVRALGAGLLGTLLLFAAFYGVRHDIGLVLAVPAFWLKLAFALAVVAAAAWVTARLSRPALRAGTGWLLAGLPVLLLWMAAGQQLLAAQPEQRLPLTLGHSWYICSLNIAILSVPLFAALFWALRGLAPTRPSQAGAAAGLLAGAISLVVYSFYCTEMALSFWGVWYVLGALAPTVAGAKLGPRVLRW